MEAVGYCQYCDEYLCGNCVNAHRQRFIDRKHNIKLDKSLISKSKSKTFKVNEQLNMIICPTHEENIQDFFCKDHTQLCCHVCVHMHHRSCLNIAYVPEVSLGIANKPEYERVRTDLDQLLSKATYQQKKNNRKIQANKEYHSKALADIKHFRKQINKMLDELEEETTRRIFELNRKNSEQIKIESDACQSVVTAVNSMASNLEEMVTSGMENHIYVGMKKVQPRLSELESELKTVDIQIQQYSIHQDEGFQQIISALSDIWSLFVTPDVMPTTAKYVREVNVKSVDDTEQCFISGIAVLDGDRMVVTDYNNKDVKLLDMKKNRITSRLSLSSEPNAVAKVKANQVAVSLAHDRKIEMISVSDILIRNHTIDTAGVDVLQFCCDGSRFITVSEQPASVKIIDMSGRTLNTMTTDINGKKLFIKPDCIAIGRNTDVIYVTDWEANTVTCMTTDRKVISIYRNDMLKCPLGLAVDKNGSVYVCSKDTHTIHQLSPTGHITRILLEKGQGLAHFPCEIAYGHKDDTLYVSSYCTTSGEHNYIRLYELE